MDPVNLVSALDSVTAYWSPQVVGRVNDPYVKLLGELAWQRHDEEDEVFHVLRGRLRIQFEAGQETLLEAGEFRIVPKGAMHNPVAEEECWIVLVETTTKHTGDVATPRTRSIEQQLA